MKRCSKCGIEKPMEEFSPSAKGGSKPWCRSCVRIYDKEYALANKEKISAQRKQYRIAHKEEIAKKSKERYLANRESRLQQCKEYRDTHREEKLIRDRNYYYANREELLLKSKEWRLTHKEELVAYKKKYNPTHKEHIAAHKKEYSSTHKEFIAAGQKVYRKNNKEKLTKKSKDYYLDNKETLKTKIKEYQQTPVGKMVKAKTSHKRRSVAKNTECTLTADQWQRILELQRNKCVLCGKIFTKKDPATKDHIIPVIPYNGAFTRENTQALHASCNARKSNRLDKSNIVVWISALAQET